MELAFGALAQVLTVAIICGAIIANEWLKRQPTFSKDAVLKELEGIREELRQLRQQHQDVILNLDSGMHDVDRRLARLETGPLAASTEEAGAVAQRAGRG